MAYFHNSRRRIAPNWPRIVAVGVNILLWALAARYLVWVASGMRL
jgi:hypothetical protein